MKRYIYSVLIALVVLSTLTAAASAATNSLIGKKVQSIITLEFNGKALKDAVIIDGVTYVPARSLTEAAGYDIKIEGGKVKVTTQADDTISKTLNIKSQIQVLQNQIDTNKENIRIAESGSIAELEKKIAVEKAYTTDLAVHEAGVKALEKSLAEERTYVAELQAKIDDATAKIAVLEAQLK